MVGITDLAEEKPQLIPVIFPKRRLPIEKVWGYDAPEIRGAVILKENVLCPNCHTIEAVFERSWIGGLGWVVSLVCEAGCGNNGRNYWERSPK